MIRTGVIGNNEFCNTTLENLSDVNEFKLIGLHEPVHDNTNNLADKFNLKSYSQATEMLKDVDAVIAMPPLSCPENISYFVRNSKHVFFELSTDYSKTEANKLSAIIDEADVKVQVGLHHRFNNTFLSAKPFINNPKFIQSGNYKKFNSESQNYKALLDMLIADIDIVLSIVNAEVKNIVANAASMFPGAPDVINARIEFLNGCVAQLTAGIIATEDSHQFGFYCTKDFINIDFCKNKAWIIKKKDKNSDIKLFQENISGLCVEPINIKPNNHLYDEFHSFAKSIMYNKNPEVSIDSTIKTLSIIQVIKEKIKLSIGD